MCPNGLNMLHLIGSMSSVLGEPIEGLGGRREKVTIWPWHILAYRKAIM